jgi:uncharacterized protein YrrD
MLRAASHFIGQKVLAADGEIGVVKDIYFDKRSWTLRYCVVEIGPWLEKRQVLLIPSSLNLDQDHSRLETLLTKAQVAESPSAASDMPVSRQYENRLHDYYGWTPYWNLQGTARQNLFTHIVPLPPSRQELLDWKGLMEAKRRMEANPDLHSLREVKGYHIKATDGELGSLEDVLFDTRSYRIMHIVADTINWWPSRSVVLPRHVIKTISWQDRWVAITLTREAVKKAPTFTPNHDEMQSEAAHGI